MLVSRESFATILLANSSFRASALVNSWSCRPSSACLKACWETNEASDGELGWELSSHSSGCSEPALVFWEQGKHTISRLEVLVTMATTFFPLKLRARLRSLVLVKWNQSKSDLRLLLALKGKHRVFSIPLKQRIKTFAMRSSKQSSLLYSKWKQKKLKGLT